jgi:hypothetical protein
MKTSENVHGRIIVHDYPVWRERSDFIIKARLTQPGNEDLAESEQVWAKQLTADTFEICCIPFFAYGFALGDYVRTVNFDNDNYVIDQVVEKRGHSSYRLWLKTADETNSTIDEILSLGCSVEIRWERSRLVAADAPDVTRKIILENFLQKLKGKGVANWEVSF